MGVAGSEAAIIDRALFSTNKLNLDKWYGYQEVILKKSVGYDNATFSFEISDYSYIDFYFHFDEKVRYGIRLSTMEENPSLFFIQDKSYRFLKKYQLDLKIKENIEQFLELKKSKNKLILNIENKQIILPDLFGIDLVGIGFRGGAKPSSIDNIKLMKNNETVLLSKFTNDKNIFRIFIQHFIMLILLSFVLKFFLSTNTLIFINYCLILLMIIFYIFDFYIFSVRESFVTQKYLYSEEDVNVTLFESYHHKLIMVWGNLFGFDTDFKKQLDDTYFQKRISKGPIICKNLVKCDRAKKHEVIEVLTKNNDCHKQLFLGGSQTIGAGASSIERTFFYKVHFKKLSKIRDKCLISLNLGASGWPLEKVFKDFKDNYSHLKFNIIVLNTGINNKSDTFLEPFKNFMLFASSKKLNLIVLEEAISYEFKFFEPGLKKLIIERESEKYNIPQYSLEKYMKTQTKNREGDIWWDMAHYTDYGHQLVADWLSEKMDNHYDYGQDKAL